MSLTTLPPIRRSPLVCCSRPQMMRRNVVLPQPEGPSSTMNSPFGTLSEMPLTAGTSPNFLTISLVNTAAIEPPQNQSIALRRQSFGGANCICQRAEDPGPRPSLRGPGTASGFPVPLREDGLSLFVRPFDRFLGGHLAGRCFRHHVADDEVVVDLIDGGPGRTGISRRSRPLLGILQQRQFVGRRRR